jgi:GNAT superfamily N-acetyltransferase
MDFITDITHHYSSNSKGLWDPDNSSYNLMQIYLLDYEEEVLGKLTCYFFEDDQFDYDLLERSTEDFSDKCGDAMELFLNTRPADSWNTMLFLARISINKEHRGKGLGSHLMQVFHNHARNNLTHPVVFAYPHPFNSEKDDTLISKNKLLKFYNSLGYKETISGSLYIDLGTENFDER